MLNAIRSLVFLVALGSAQAAPVGGDGWIGDFDLAVKQAKAEKKDLLVDFTGSDWCGWCIRLKSEVFDHATFSEAVTKDYVLVSLDYPRSKPAIDKVPNPERNAALQSQYKISGYPTILLMTADGDVYAQTGYQAGGPAKYVEHLNKLRASGRSAVQLKLDYEKATPEQKEAAWLKLVAHVDAAPKLDLVIARLVPIVREGLTSDPANAKGHKRAAIAALLNVGEKDSALLASARELDPKNEFGLLQRVLAIEYRGARNEDDAKAMLAKVEELDSAGLLKQDKFAFELYALSAMFISQVGPDPVKAKAFATKALAIGSDDRRLTSICEQLVK